MSIALKPFTLAPADSALFSTPSFNQIQIPFPIHVNRIMALKIYNESPYQLVFTNIPGSGGAYHSDFTEHVYYIDTNNNWSPGYLSCSVFGVTFGFIPFNPSVSYHIYVTIYEVGDTVPESIQIYHGRMVMIGNDVSPRISLLSATGSFATGAAGSVSISAPDMSPAGIATAFYTCVSGFSIDFGHVGTRVEFDASLGPVSNGVGVAVTMKFHIDLEASTSFDFGMFRTFPNPLISFQAAAANNTVTLSIPATTNVPAYSMNIWGYAIGQTQII
jgi:hypothetical protein